MFSAAALDTLAVYLLSDQDPDNGVGTARDNAVHMSRVDTVTSVSDPLAERIRAGDADAFAAVVHEHYNGLVRFAASLLHVSRDVSHDAEDLVQEVLSRVWDRRAQLDPRRALQIYLFTAVRNGALNRMRDERAAKRIVHVQAGDVEYPSVPSPADDFDAGISDADDAVRLQSLAQALQQLPERSRTALLLRFERGMTHAEVGTILGLSEKAAQQVVLRTIAGLRRLLRPPAG